MTNSDRVSFVCTTCGYTNVYSRDEILQRGEEVLFRGEKEEIFSLPCKNPALACPQRTQVAVPIKQK
jgi:hypothetical protein